MVARITAWLGAVGGQGVDETPHNPRAARRVLSLSAVGGAKGQATLMAGGRTSSPVRSPLRAVLSTHEDSSRRELESVLPLVR